MYSHSTRNIYDLSMHVRPLQPDFTTFLKFDLVYPPFSSKQHQKQLGLFIYTAASGASPRPFFTGNSFLYV